MKGHAAPPKARTFDPSSDTREDILDAPLLFHLDFEWGDVSLHQWEPRPGHGERYVLHWTDGVINEWFEEFEVLSTAIARLAVLIRGGEDEQYFTHSEARDFAETWEAMLFPAFLDDAMASHQRHEFRKALVLR